MKPFGFIWRWKAKDINQWQFRAVPVHPDNYDLIDTVPIYTEEMLKQAKREALLDVAEWFDDGYEYSPANNTSRVLRRKAWELK